MNTSSRTPAMDPGTLPTASAITTLRRTVPLLRCMMLAGILVKKLNSASEPTDTIGEYPRPKISTGSSRTPPPTPVRPMRTPTTKPTRILAASIGIVGPLLLLAGAVHADEAFALQVENDLLRGLLGRKFAGVDGDFGIGRNFVRIGDTSEFLKNAGTRLGVESLAIALLADLNARGDVHQDESTIRLDHLANVFAGRVIRRDGRTNGDPAVLGNFRRHVPDAADVDVAMFFGESQFGREMLAHKVAVEDRDRASADFQELGE